MRCYRWSLLLLLGCSSTGPNSSTPEVGRYDYSIQAAGLSANGDLVISAATESQAVYRFYMPGVPLIGTAQTNYSPAGGWIFASVPKLGWVASNTMTRSGNNYGCSAQVVGPAGITTATCSFTYEGPDSVRTSP